MEPLTLQDLFEMGVLGDAQVLTASERLTHRRVDWVSVIEIPVEDFVRQDELVLTTAIGCGDDPTALAAFVEEVCLAGAAGLAIATGKYVETIPDGVIALATSHHFPLLTIPWDVRFADVSRRVSLEIAVRNAELGGMQGFLQPVLLHLAHDPSWETLMPVLGRALNAGLAFCDGSSGIWWGSADLVAWCQAEMDPALSYLRSPLPNGIGTSYKLRRVEISHRVVGVLPVVTGDRWLGTLIIAADNLFFEPSDTYHEMISHVVALAYLHQEAKTRISLQRHEDLVWKLAKGEFNTWDEVMANAAGFETDVAQFYLVMVGMLDNWDALYADSQTVFRQIARSAWDHEVIETVRRSLGRAGASAGFHVISTFQRGEWLAFAFTPRRAEPSAWNAVLQAANQALSFRVAHGQLSWGVALGVPGVQGFHQAYQNAHRALERGRRQDGPGGIYEYERIGHERVLARFLEDDDVRQIVQTTIGSLVTYDQQHSADLIHTLAVYLQNRTNVSMTARTLHLHRQSLLYRLRKIEILTGRSLDNADDLFLLEMCVRMVRLTQGSSAMPRE